MRFQVPGRTVAVAVVAAVAFGGGGAYAAGRITGAQIVNGTVTSRDVKDHSLRARDFRGGLPAGPRGPQGPAGPGASTAAVKWYKVTAVVTVAAGDPIGKASAACPS